MPSTTTPTFWVLLAPGNPRPGQSWSRGRSSSRPNRLRPIVVRRSSAGLAPPPPCARAGRSPRSRGGPRPHPRRGARRSSTCVRARSPRGRRPAPSQSVHEPGAIPSALIVNVLLLAALAGDGCPRAFAALDPEGLVRFVDANVDSATGTGSFLGVATVGSERAAGSVGSQRHDRHIPACGASHARLGNRGGSTASERAQHTDSRQQEKCDRVVSCGHR